MNEKGPFETPIALSEAIFEYIYAQMRYDLTSLFGLFSLFNLDPGHNKMGLYKGTMNQIITAVDQVCKNPPPNLPENSKEYIMNVSKQLKSLTGQELVVFAWRNRGVLREIMLSDKFKINMRKSFDYGEVSDVLT